MSMLVCSACLMPYPFLLHARTRQVVWCGGFIFTFIILTFRLPFLSNCRRVSLHSHIQQRLFCTRTVYLDPTASFIVPIETSVHTAVVPLREKNVRCA